MPAFRLTIVLGLAIFALATQKCWAQEPTDRETIEELRREVIELRKAVSDLTKQLAEMEYQQLPRAAESPKEPAPELPRTVFEFSEPQRLMDDSRVPKIIDTRQFRSKLRDVENPRIPKNFRFPINIERGSGTPTPPRRALDRWLP